MTISQAIAALQTIKEKYGDVQVFFDCPKCGVSFTPTTAATVAAHLTEQKR